MLKYRKAHFLVLAISTVAYKCSLEKILESFLKSSFFGKWKSLSYNLYFYQRTKFFAEKHITNFSLLLVRASHRCEEDCVTFFFGGGGKF